MTLAVIVSRFIRSFAPSISSGRAALLLIATACAVSGPDSVPVADPSSAAQESAPRDGCGLADGEHSIEVAGQTRTFIVDRGPAKVRGPRPVVFIWHGFGAYSPRIVSLIDGQLWPEAIRVAPKGLPRTFDNFGDVAQLGWQVRRGEYEDRDLAFFDAIYARLTAEGCVDNRRVYTTGFSNGGFFSNVLACHRADRLAAAAPTGGGGPFEPCTGRIPILIHHGTQDTVVPFRMADQSFRAWCAHHGCDYATPSGGCISADKCPVTMCTAEIGHRWPTEASKRIVGFFKAHARGGGGPTGDESGD